MSRENTDGASAWLSSLGGFDAGAGIRMKIDYCLAGCRGIEFRGPVGELQLVL
jgi:hypothetical protein